MRPCRGLVFEDLVIGRWIWHEGEVKSLKEVNNKRSGVTWEPGLCGQ